MFRAYRSALRRLDAFDSPRAARTIAKSKLVFAHPHRVRAALPAARSAFSSTSPCPKSAAKKAAAEAVAARSASGFWSDTSVWGKAASNTVRCLVGCSLGDFSMLFYLQSQHPQVPMSVQMSLAMAGGLSTSLALETVVLKVTEKFPWRLAAKTAFNMSFISMLAMEAAANAVDVHLTGGVVNFGSASFWAALVPSLAAGFLAPLPYNYYQLKKFKKSCH